MIDTVLSWLFKLLGIRQSIKVRCHCAMFSTGGPICIFINVVNRSLQRDAEITHVWFELDGEIPVSNESRKLPRRLQPEESWETWVEIGQLGETFSDDYFNAARVRLSNGRIVKSKRNRAVPSAGEVPGS